MWDSLSTANLNSIICLNFSPAVGNDSRFGNLFVQDSCLTESFVCSHGDATVVCFSVCLDKFASV